MSINRKPMPNGRHNDKRPAIEQARIDAVEQLRVSAAMVARNARNDATYGNAACAQCEPGAPLFADGKCTLCSACRAYARIETPSKPKDKPYCAHGIAWRNNCNACTRRRHVNARVR